MTLHYYSILNPHFDSFLSRRKKAKGPDTHRSSSHHPKGPDCPQISPNLTRHLLILLLIHKVNTSPDEIVPHHTTPLSRPIDFARTANMVRLPLPHRISHRLEKGGTSAEASGAQAPSRQGSLNDIKPLILKVNVLRVRSYTAVGVAADSPGP